MRFARIAPCGGQLQTIALAPKMLCKQKRAKNKNEQRKAYTYTTTTTTTTVSIQFSREKSGKLKIKYANTFVLVREHWRWLCVCVCAQWRHCSYSSLIWYYMMYYIRRTHPSTYNTSLKCTHQKNRICKLCIVYVAMAKNREIDIILLCTQNRAIHILCHL